VYDYTSSRPSVDQEGRLGKIQHISIFQVGKISTTLQLEEHIIKSQDDALLEEDQEIMSLLISKTSRHLTRDSKLCMQIASYLDVPFSELFGIVKGSLEEVEVMFADRGISNRYQPTLATALLVGFIRGDRQSRLIRSGYPKRIPDHRN